MTAINTGLQGWFILEGINVDNDTLTGFKKPNLQNNSPQALVPEAATITYSYPTDATPGSGANGDIWYNPVADQLFKRISGTWVLLTDRVPDSDYVAPVENLTDCPIS